MNQEKIGKFISECRKAKRITQSELAEQLGVTDRSVSNWENGKNMPDLSLFKPLCEILNITINELLSGEKINKDNYQEKLEENIINTINYSNKKLEQKNQLIGLILLLFGFLISTLGLMAFNLDTHACSFSIVIGIILGTIGFYKLIKTKSYIKNITCLVLFFIGYVAVILLFDYIGVAYNKRPPIFSTTITTIDDTIYYDTIFYDVVRCNKNQKNETFKIIKNQEHNDEIILNICK
jgi:transcriptional regulator with XRE-family HTH domain